MQILCFYDWRDLELEPFFYDILSMLKRIYFDRNKFLLILNDRVKKNINCFDKLESALLMKKNTRSIIDAEAYIDISDSSDPELSWSSYFSLSCTKQGAKTFILAFNEPEMDDGTIRCLIEKLSSHGNFGYGFFTKYNGNGDGRYFCVGVSTGTSSSKEMDDDARWMIERIVMRGDDFPRNRHLQGMFRAVFEMNILDIKHVSNLFGLCNDKSFTTELTELKNNNYLWVPSEENRRIFEEILKKNKLLI